MEWIGHQAQIANPLDFIGIRSLAFEISGKEPGVSWIQKLEKWHPTLQQSQPSCLDPKQAQHFNKTNIKDYFELMEKLNTEYPDLPPEHMWNMDEKGIQMGDSKENNRKLYYWLRGSNKLKKKNFYRICCDNLQLVTVTECISASGALMPPAFVLSQRS